MSFSNFGSLLLFGPAFGLVLLAGGIGGVIAEFAARYKRIVVPVTIAAMVASSIVLMTVPILVPIVAAHVVLGVGAVMLSVLFLHNLHESLPSRVRAGASSAVSTIGRLLLIPASLIFGVISQEVSVFAATGLLLAIVVVIGVCALRIRRMPKTVSPHS